MSNNVTCNSKKCEVCETVYQPKSNRQKYCTKCTKVLENKRRREKHKQRYKRKGYNQKGENNNGWKGGSPPYYKRIAHEAYGKICNRCESEENILVHHKDRDRGNNELENLEVLCKKCHQLEHKSSNNLGNFLGNADRPRDIKGHFTKAH